MLAIQARHNGGLAMMVVVGWGEVLRSIQGVDSLSSGARLQVREKEESRVSS